MNEVWMYLNTIDKVILAFSSEKKLIQWAQEKYPNMKSLRLLPDTLGAVYTLVNHNTHLYPYSHRIYRLDLDTKKEGYLWFF